MIKSKHILALMSTLVFAVTCTSIYAQEPEKVSIKFSIFYSHSAPDVSGGRLKKVTDLYYAHGEKNVPIRLKASRQSMAYPYIGPRKMVLFRLENVDGELKRIPVARCNIHVGAKIGILLMADTKKNKMSVKSFWFKKEALRRGAKLINLSGSTVGIRLKGQKIVALSHTKSMKLEAKYKAGSDFAFVAFDGYLSVDTTQGKKARKAIHRNVCVSKKSGVLLLLLKKQQRFLSMESLLLNGVPNSKAAADISEFFPKKKKLTSITMD